MELFNMDHHTLYSMSMLEDEDDTHLCLKCRATITGLDNYVRHRKAGCPPPIDREPELRADDFFSSLELQSKKVPDDPYDDLDDDLEDDEDAGVPPRSHTGGKWRPSAASWNILTPPPSFTGGKWRPIIMAPESEAPVVEPPQPPPQQTPPTPTDQEPQAGRSSWDDDGGPPPGHTSGKWMPGRRAVRKQGNTVQYWCGPCSRQLSSRSMYQRHLQSELHFKRTAVENQLSEEPQVARTNKRAPGKRLVRRTAAYVQSHLWGRSKRKRLQEEADDLKKETTKDVDVPSTTTTPTPTTRGRRRRLEQCGACRARFPAYQWGKHLLSHIHWRRGVVFRSVHETLVLQHMDSLVRLAPFRCQPCRFYCNSGDVLLQHIRSSTHIALDRKLEGEFWCSLCRHWAASSEGLQIHLVSPHHLELVSAAGGSVPVELRRRQLPSCSTCSMVFQYRIQLKVHGRRTGHSLGAATSGIAQVVQCSHCPFKGRSRMSLQRHSILKHGLGSYFCSTCSKEFASAQEALAHRRSQEHRSVLIERYGAKKRHCSHCGEVVNSLQQLKEHILEAHSEETHQCQLCGQKFALPQELTRHVRAKACGVAESDALLEHGCSICPYRSQSRAELLFHSALHLGKRRLIPCPECGAVLRRRALLGHLRTHTNERPHSCPACGRAFHQRSALLVHVRQVHGDEWHSCPHCSFRSTSKKSAERHIRTHGPRDRSFLCAVCGRSFFLKSTLQQHMKLHAGKDVSCPTPDCVYRCRTLAELRTHQRTHSDERPYHCDSCSYASKTKAQLLRHNQIHLGEKPYKCHLCAFSSRLSTHLKRHLRVHTGAKPFKCPHCPYTCNILENLRKHVINTNRHPGKKLYECSLCAAYDTNLATEFRVHLVQQHPDTFRSVAVAASYVAGLYNNEDDITSVSTPQQWTAVRSNPKSSPESLVTEMVSMKDADGDGCWTEQVVEVRGDGICISEEAQVQQEAIVLIDDSHADVKNPELQFLTVASYNKWDSKDV